MLGDGVVWLQFVVMVENLLVVVECTFMVVLIMVVVVVVAAALAVAMRVGCVLL